MSDARKKYEQLRLLLVAITDGRATQQQFDELNALLRDDPAMCDIYLDYMSLHGELAHQFGSTTLNVSSLKTELMDSASLLNNDAPGGSAFGQMLAALDDAHGEAAKPVDVSDLMRRRKVEEQAKRQSLPSIGSLAKTSATTSTTKHYVIPRPLFYGSIAAIIAIAAVIIMPLIQNDDQERETEIVDSTVPDPVAQLVANDSAQWATDSLAVRPNGTLLPGDYELTSGSVMIGFFEGAEVTVSAPAKFELLGTNAGSMAYGSASIYVPESAHGFAIDIPGTKLVDLGTQFSVKTAISGSSHVAVQDGLIEMRVREESGRIRAVPLNENETAHLDAEGEGYALRIPFAIDLKNTGQENELWQRDSAWSVIRLNTANRESYTSAVVAMDNSEYWQMDETSKWLSYPSDQNKVIDFPGEMRLKFKQEFTLPQDVDLSSVRIRLRLIADDIVTVFLNDRRIAGPIGKVEAGPARPETFRAFHEVELTDGFHRDRNELVFRVDNRVDYNDSPMGLRVEFLEAVGERLIKVKPTSGQ